MSLSSYERKKTYQLTVTGDTKFLGVEENYKPTTDPRPDLAEDSKQWTEFLGLAECRDWELAETLCGFRCMGTRLKQGNNGYILRPDIDPTGNLAWTSRKEYEEAREKWLRPYTREIKELLEGLKRGEKM